MEARERNREALLAGPASSEESFEAPHLVPAAPHYFFPLRHARQILRCKYWLRWLLLPVAGKTGNNWII